VEYDKDLIDHPVTTSASMILTALAPKPSYVSKSWGFFDSFGSSACKPVKIMMFS
jgi:hypothetical protein